MCKPKEDGRIAFLPFSRERVCIGRDKKSGTKFSLLCVYTVWSLGDGEADHDIHSPVIVAAHANLEARSIYIPIIVLTLKRDGKVVTLSVHPSTQVTCITKIMAAFSYIFIQIEYILLEYAVNSGQIPH